MPRGGAGGKHKARPRSGCCPAFALEREPSPVDLLVSLRLVAVSPDYPELGRRHGDRGIAERPQGVSICRESPLTA